MSETTNLKAFRMKKAIPGNLLIIVHPFSNPELKKEVYLTDRHPIQVLPLDWALGIFIDNGNYNMYKEGYFTFENNEDLAKAAYEAGAYFDDELDFTPVKEDLDTLILPELKSGNRARITSAIDKYGKEKVQIVASSHVGELNVNVVNMLESLLKVQLIMDNEIIESND